MRQKSVIPQYLTQTEKFLDELLLLFSVIIILVSFNYLIIHAYLKISLRFMYSTNLTVHFIFILILFASYHIVTTPHTCATLINTPS